MSKLNKREQTLIVFLLLAVCLFISARALKKSMLDRQQLQTENSQILTEINLLEIRKDSVDEFVETSMDLIKEIEKSSEAFFSGIKQEEMIKILEEFNNQNDFEIIKIDFNEMNQKEAVTEEELEEAEVPEEAEETEEGDTNELERIKQEYGIETNTVLIEFQSDYESLVDYVKRINDFNKSMYVRAVEVNANNDTFETNVTEEEIYSSKSILTGKIQVDFVTLPLLDNIDVSQGYDISYDSELSNRTNPFIPYNEYIQGIVEENREEVIETPVDNNTGEDGTGSGENSYNEEEYYETITGFEADDFFFVGSPKDVTGETGLNNNSYSGMWSGELQYNFTNGVNENIANFVFDKEVLVLNEQVEKILLKVYSDQYSYHTIGLVILDSAGKEHDIVLTDGVYWTDWNTLEVIPDKDITYPAVISRIYVSDNGEKSNLNGKYLFDDLEVLYSKDVERGVE